MTKGKLGRAVFTIVLIVIFIALTATSVFFFLQYRKALEKDPTREIEQITKKITKFMDLPSQSPQLATVTDKEKLISAGFKKVENGDKILFFIEAGQAIVYRPSSERVVDVLPIRTNEQQASGSAKNVNTASVTPIVTQAPTTSTTVTFYNGTTTKGLSTKAEAILTKSFAQMSVADRANAARTDYSNSVIVDLSGEHNSEAQQLATVYKGTVSQLPVGEPKPTSDILVILGKSFAGETLQATPTALPTQIP